MKMTKTKTKYTNSISFNYKEVYYRLTNTPFQSLSVDIFKGDNALHFCKFVSSPYTTITYTTYSEYSFGVYAQEGLVDCSPNWTGPMNSNL